MLSRIKRLGSIGKGVVMTHPSGPSFPSYGTVLSISCGTDQGQGTAQATNDVLGTGFYLSLQKWLELADGVGGSFWQDSYNSNSTPCFYPYGFVYDGFVNTDLNWSAPNGSNGTFTWGEHWDVNYYDGSGGTVHESGYYNQYPYLYAISTSDENGTVYNLLDGNWAFWYYYGYNLAQQSTVYYNANVGCGDFVIYSTVYDLYADGMGGTYGEYNHDDYPSYGTLLNNCNGNNYYADGFGGYYDVPENTNPAYGTYLGSGSGGDYVTVDCINVQVSGYSYDIYADGNGGTYNETTGGANYYSYGSVLGTCGYITYYSDGGSGYYSQDNTPQYPSYGTFAYNQDNYNYYNDGNGGYYQGEYTGSGGGCPDYGTMTNQGQNDLTYNIDGNNYSIGTQYWTQYDDGNCGTYETDNNVYLTYGTYITQSEVLDLNTGWVITLNWHSDGAGGIYATL